MTFLARTGSGLKVALATLDIFRATLEFPLRMGLVFTSMLSRDWSMVISYRSGFPSAVVRSLARQPRRPDPGAVVVS